MDWKCVLIFAQVLISQSITHGSEVVLQVNTKKWIYYVPERFLSLTVDPLSLTAASPLTHESLNLAKGLSPCFVRLGGIGTNAVFFGKEFMVNSSTVSESQWDSINEFAKRAGLDLIASLNPAVRVNGEWDPQNSNELISYSDAKGHNVVWQLGYDLNGHSSNGQEIGRDLMKLKKILDEHPRYNNVPIFGPDLKSVWGAKQIHLIKDLLSAAGNSMGSVILQPAFTNGDGPEDPYDLITSMTNELDTYVWNKDPRMSKPIPKKPIWIAEPMASQGTFSDAMKLVKRIGYSARLGVQVYMRQAGMDSLKSPTADFWFSLLYKNLVGQGVLDNKVVSKNVSGLYMFSHCTPALPQEKSVLDSDWAYEKGAVTTFGVNESPGTVKLTLKATSKEESLHIYILTPGKSEGAYKPGETLLNGQLLRLSPNQDLPVLSPRIKRPSKLSSVVIPGESIFFVVMPDSKVRTCSMPPLAPPDINLSSLTRRLRLGQPAKLENSDEDKLEPEDQSDERVYVSFTKKKRHDVQANTPKIDLLGKNLMKTLISKLSPPKIDYQAESTSNKEHPVKYVPFNEDSFFNRLVEGLKEELKEESDGGGDSAQKSAASPPRVIDLNLAAVQEPSAQSKAESSLTRKRRSSTEEPPSEGKLDKELATLKHTVDSKKEGILDGGTGQLLSLGQISGNLPTPVGDTAQISRIVRNTEEQPVQDDEKEESAESSEEDEGKGSSEVTNEEAAEDIAKTSELIKVMQETEKNQNVSDNSEDHIMIPPVISDKDLGKLMLETAQLKSDKELYSNPSAVKIDNLNKDDADPPEEQTKVAQPQLPDPPSAELQPSAAQNEGEPPAILLMQDPQQMHQPSPVQPQLYPQPNNDPAYQTAPPNFVPLAGNAEMSTGDNPNDDNSPLSFHPDVAPAPINYAPADTGIGQSNGGNPDNTPSPVLTMNDQSDSQLQPQQLPAYSEKKENAINRILSKIVEEQDEKLANIPPGEIKPETLETNGDDLVAVPISESDTIMMAPEDLKTISGNPPENYKVTTLESVSPELDMENSEDIPKVKVLRQASSVTPISLTATLTAPLQESITPRPASIVSPIKAPSTSSKDSGSLARESPIKPPPSAEELRERIKSMRDKMMELRSQYIAAREKRLEEIKKSVAVARSSSGSTATASASASAASVATTADVEEAIKSTIKRREAELKEWFKKFDKREAGFSSEHESEGGQVKDSLTDKPRPRRLSLFAKDEGIDLDKFLNEDPTETTNFKRSPETDSQYQYNSPSSYNDQRQYSPYSRMNSLFGKYLFPLDVKTQGIVYNNKIYPAKIYGFVEPRTGESISPGMEYPNMKIADKPLNYMVSEQVNEGESREEMPKSKERLAVVPRDAFIKEVKSDYIPVVIIPPDQPEVLHSYESIQPSRAKRSTWSNLEDHFHQLKQELVPKINSFINNLRENPPWKRDLERSSRSRRSIEDVTPTNELKSLKEFYLKKLRQEKPWAIIGNYAEQMSGNDEASYKETKKHANVKDNDVDKDGDNKKTPDTGYCEEIGTGEKSVIRDPFEEQNSSENPNPSDQQLSTGDKSDKNPLNSKDSRGSTSFEDKIFASYVAEKIKSFFSTISDLMASSTPDQV